MSRARLLCTVAVVLTPLAGWVALYRLSDDLLRPPRPRVSDPQSAAPAQAPVEPDPTDASTDAHADARTDAHADARTDAHADAQTDAPVPLPRSPAELGLPFEEIAFAGWGGVTMRGWYVAAPPSIAPVGSVVVLHGNASNRQAGLLLARTLHAAGFAVLLPDFTGRGDSDGVFCTYGFHETEDARQAARQAAVRLPRLPVALVGRSLGAAVALLTAADPQGAPVDAVVADSGYASLSELVSARRAELHIPAWPFEPLFYSMVRWRAGFDPRAIDIEGAAHRVRVPVLVIHGENDTDVPMDHALRIVAALAGRHELLSIPGAGHNTPRTEDVRERIRSFLLSELRPPAAVEL